MRLGSVAVVLAMVASQTALAQQAANPPVPAAVATPAAMATPATGTTRTIIVPRDTPVQLMVWNEVSTKDRGVGYLFKLRVQAPVVIDGATVIPTGATAWGEVTSAQRSGAVGRGGELGARLVGVDVGGRRIRLEGETTTKGHNAKGEVIAAVVGLGVLGLLMRGNNAKIKAGELMTGFIVEDTPVAVPIVAAR
jgi:hypothetical protein